MAWRMSDGTAKASLWPDPGNGRIWIPTDDELKELYDIPGIDEISSECAQPYKIIVEADSVEELVATVSRVREAAMLVIRKYTPHRRAEAAVERRITTACRSAVPR